MWVVNSKHPNVYTYKDMLMFISMQKQIKKQDQIISFDLFNPLFDLFDLFDIVICFHISMFCN